MAQGTYDITTLLAARNTSMAELGEQAVVRALAADVAAHNAMVFGYVNDAGQRVPGMFSALCEVTADRARVWGGNSSSDMVRVGQYGRTNSQEPLAGQTVGFPMDYFEHAEHVTRRWLETADAPDIALRQLDAERSHKRRIEKEIQRAIFKNTNYTYVDENVDNVDLYVKRFLNADGVNIPDGVAGQSFVGSSHTHYNAAAVSGSASTADVLSLVDNVREHGHSAGLTLFVNYSETAQFENLGVTGGYVPLDLVIVPQNGTLTAIDMGGSIAYSDKIIGKFKNIPVMAVSWMPAGYLFCSAINDARKPLALRQRSGAALQGLRMPYMVETSILRAEYYTTEFGVAVWERSNGACLYFANNVWANYTGADDASD